LQDIEGGAALVRQTKARESAKSLAVRFLQSRMFEPAIEFYLIAGMQSQALEIAKQQNCVDFFASLVKDDASIDLRKI
jgi:WD repeat-containing protein 19